MISASLAVITPLRIDSSNSSRNSFSEIAGVPDSDEGLSMAGARFQPWEDFSIGAIDYYVEDVINIAYAEADWHHAFNSMRFRAIAPHCSAVTCEEFFTP